MNKISQLVQTGKTVFTIPEMVDIWDADRNTVKTTVSRMVQRKNLFRLTKGYYALHPNIDLFELGCKLMKGSYISLFTVLKKAGVIFQEYQTIYLIGPRPKVIKVQNTVFEYHTIQRVLSIPDGIDFLEHSSVATLERAILDLFSLFDTDYSDFKMSRLDKEKFLKLSHLYNQKTQKKAFKFIKDFAL